jgi:hypothetical protein
MGIWTQRPQQSKLYWCQCILIRNKCSWTKFDVILLSPSFLLACQFSECSALSVVVSFTVFPCFHFLGPPQQDLTRHSLHFISFHTHDLGPVLTFTSFSFEESSDLFYHFFLKKLILYETISPVLFIH